MHDRCVTNVTAAASPIIHQTASSDAVNYKQPHVSPTANAHTATLKIVHKCLYTLAPTHTQTMLLTSTCDFASCFLSCCCCCHSRWHHLIVTPDLGFHSRLHQLQKISKLRICCCCWIIDCCCCCCRWVLFRSLLCLLLFVQCFGICCFCYCCLLLLQ